MQHRRLGKSAVYVSDICMGTMTFGNQADETMSHRILDKSFEAGINFFDTAENYPVPPKEEYAGRTEEIVGRWMKTKNRDALIIATKVCGPSHGWIKGSQRAGMTALDRVRRLRTSFGSQAPQSPRPSGPPICGTPAEPPQPSMITRSITRLLS